MEESDKKDYAQDAHLRYILDHFSSENGRIIKNRKARLINLGFGILILIVLLQFFPTIRELLLAVAILLVYLIGKEMGRREGYLKAYKSLPQYDYKYPMLWKESRNREHLESGVSNELASYNIQESLKRLDFQVKDDTST